MLMLPTQDARSLIGPLQICWNARKKEPGFWDKNSDLCWNCRKAELLYGQPFHSADLLYHLHSYVCLRGTYHSKLYRRPSSSAADCRGDRREWVGCTRDG